MAKKESKAQADESAKTPPARRYVAFAVVRLSGGVEVELEERLAAKRGRRISRLDPLAKGANPDGNARAWFRTNEAIDIKLGERFGLRGPIEKGQESRVEPEK